MYNWNWNNNVKKLGFEKIIFNTKLDYFFVCVQNEESSKCHRPTVLDKQVYALKVV